jgi:hypothetical protein
MAATDTADVDLMALDARVEVRNEDWLVTKVTRTPFDGAKVRAIGLSELVREQEAVFCTDLDKVKPLRPEETTLATYDSPRFRHGRLFLEALLRRTQHSLAETRSATYSHDPLRARPPGGINDSLRKGLLRPHETLEKGTRSCKGPSA